MARGGRHWGGTACSGAYANTGEFSAEYTAWAERTGDDAGVIGRAVRMAPGKSVLGLSSIGPLSHDHPRTVARWVRAPAATPRTWSGNLNQINSEHSFP
jgi:hypothetical protein